MFLSFLFCFKVMSSLNNFVAFTALAIGPNNNTDINKRTTYQHEYKTRRGARAAAAATGVAWWAGAKFS